MNENLVDEFVQYVLTNEGSFDKLFIEKYRKNGLDLSATEFLELRERAIKKVAGSLGSGYDWESGG